MGKNNGGTREGRGKRHFLEENDFLLDSSWVVKLFARLTELSWSDVPDTCASSRHFLLARKSAKKSLNIVTLRL